MIISTKELGAALINEAEQHATFSHRRGLINELFPFVFEASKRMSCRAISRWLETKGHPLSAATIAKALRNPSSHWQELADEVEPMARIFAESHRAEITELLRRPELFEALREMPPTFQLADQDSVQLAMEAYEDAKQILSENWFLLPSAAREACLVYAGFCEEQGQ